MVKEFTLGKMDPHTKVTSKTARNTVMVYKHGLVVISTMVNGLKENNTATESKLNQTVINSKVSM